MLRSYNTFTHGDWLVRGVRRKHDDPPLLKRGGQEYKEFLPKKETLLRKTAMGPDFIMSGHSANTTTGRIKTTENTYDLENRLPVDPDKDAKEEKQQVEKTRAIIEVEKNRAVRERLNRFAMLHPRQRIKGLSKSAKLGQSLFGGLMGMTSGAMTAELGASGGSDPEALGVSGLIGTAAGGGFA